MGGGRWCEVQQGQVLCPALGHNSLLQHSMGWGRVAGKLPGRKGPGGAGPQVAGREPACVQEAKKATGILLGSAVVWPAGPRQGLVPLYPALVRQRQESCLWLWGPQHKTLGVGASPERGHKAGEGSGAQDL